MLKSDVYQKNLFGLVTDEAHVVPKWGKGNSNQPKGKRAAFRECFFKIGEVRSILPQGTPIIALTATATEEIKIDTMKGLGMKADTHHVSISPDRPNIYLYKKKVTKHIKETFQWLINNIREQSVNTPKTIIYCKSQKECGKLFKHFKYELGSNAYYPQDAPQLSTNRLIGMYHANTLRKHKETVANGLFDSNGICRLVFASTALGMGINFKDIKQVIHYGPPRQMEDFVQEIGRAGRDGGPAEALLFFTGGHLVKCENAVKEYAKSTDICLRKIMLDPFNEKPSTQMSKHECCVNCHKKCQCIEGKCSVTVKDYNIGLSSQVTYDCQRKVTPEQKEQLRELLTDFKETLLGSCQVFLLSPYSTTAFSDVTIKSVLKTCKYLFTVEHVLELNPIFKRDHAVEVLHMVRDVFEDFEMDSYDEFKEFEVDTCCDLEYGGVYENETSDEESVSSEGSDISGIMEFK